MSLLFGTPTSKRGDELLYEVWSVSTVTWGDRVRLSPSSMSFGRTMNQGSTGTCDFFLGDPAVAEIANLEALYPGSRMIVVEHSNVILFAGIIWDATYDMDAQSLSLTLDDIWSLWDLRLIAQDKTEDITKWKSELTGLSHGTVIKRALQWGTTGVGYEIPLSFPADQSGAVSRKVFGYDMDTVQDLITEMLAGGPDLDFRPRWTSSGTLAWDVLIGDLTASMIEVNFAAEDPGAKALKVTTTADNLATHVFAVGEGSEVDMLVRESQSANIATFPQLDRVHDSKNIRSGADLYAAAATELVSRNQATRQISMQVHLRHRPDESLPAAYPASAMTPGMRVRWYIRNDPYFTTGWRIWDVIKYSGSIDSEWLTLSFQEKGG